MTYTPPARWTTAELHGGTTSHEVAPSRVLRQARRLGQIPVDPNAPPEQDQPVADMHAFNPDARDPE
jgi:hypothetical protein